MGKAVSTAALLSQPVRWLTAPNSPGADGNLSLFSTQSPDCKERPTALFLP
jgi:hypothetical protein